MGAKRKKNQPTPTAESAVKRDLRSPKYRMRVVSNKTRYDRKKHKKVRLEDCPKAA